MKEINELRKTREKHFLNEDGTITAYVYNEDVHYLDNGEYKEIDNSLIEENDYITNKNNNFKIKLYKDKYLVNIELDNENYLNITLRNSFGVSPKVNNNEIIYEDILPNVDFKYLIHGKSLKENIYLNNKIDTNIIFNVDTNLKLVLKDNKVLAMNEDKIIYTFDSLFMVDANDNVSTNCRYELREKDGCYEIELILDEYYLSSASYPVVVDPSITTDEVENVFCSTIFSDRPNHVAGINLKSLLVQSNSERVTRSILKFVLPNISTGDNVINASIYLSPNSVHIGKELKPIGVYEVNKNWDESTVCWENMNDNYNKDIETYFCSTSLGLVGETNYSIVDITNLYNEWSSGKENNGVMLKLIDENDTSGNSDYSFYSKWADIVTDDNNNNVARRPFLIVQYREQNGILDYMTYEDVALSKGALYVNNCTGNMTMQISLSEILDKNSLFGLNLTYNSGDVISNKDNGFGQGFNFSYNERISKSNNQLTGGDYKYTSGDGAVHYFYKNEDDIYKDEDGLSLILEIINETTNEYRLLDKNGNKYIFNNSYLSRIEFVDSTFINIIRDNNKIIKIVDSKNNEANITYEINRITFSSKKSISINLVDNKISSIETKDGNISITYDTNSLVSKVNDCSGMSVGLEYYETSPYKVKKITQYGLNNKVGKYKIFEYGFYTTTVTDNDGIKYRYSFNRMGNTTSTMLVSKDGSLKNMIGFSASYVNELSTPNTNKLQSETLPISYTENLLNNSSLESSNYSLFSDFKSTEKARTGSCSAKIMNETSSFDTVNLQEGKSYVFSGYANTSSGASIQIKLYENNINDLPYEVDVCEILPTNDFERFEIPIYSISNYKIMQINAMPYYGDALYLDDFQLEEGDVASTYNLLENGNFKNNIYGWEISGRNDEYGSPIYQTHQLITLDSGERAIKLESAIDGSILLTKTIPMNGKKGDIYTLSFMYKNEGILDGADKQGNFAHLNFGYPEDDEGIYNHETYDIYFNYHSKEWQMYNEVFVAEEDYDSITIDVLSIHEINSIYVTNFSLVKDLGNYSYNYDDEGNLISTYDVMKNKTEFKYDNNNELTSMFDAKGNNFKYEYDNVVTDRVLKGISPTGISNEMKYDEHGNVVKTIINNVNPKSGDIEGNYYIRSKGTDKYITPNLKTGELTLKDDTCSHYSYKIESTLENDTKLYKVASSILNNYVIVKLSDKVVLLKDANSTKLEFIKKNNGSYNIKIYNEDAYLKVTDNNQINLSPLEENNPAFEFYFEDIDTNEFIETSSKYTEDGKYITEITDSLGNKTIYNINTEKGLTDSITNPKGLETKYTYDEKDRLKSVDVDNKIVEYTYDNNSIDTIKTGNKVFKFEYDEFFNPAKVSINNKTLVTNEYYENNGQLKSVTYGNGDKVNYKYDEFNRLKSYDHFYNYYNNYGLLSQVGSYDYNYEKYYHDYAKRLSTYIYLDKFKVNYKYDENSNISNKSYSIFNDIYNINYEFNGDDSVIKVKFDNNELNYEYDYLGRLKSRNINNQIPEYFTYKKNGNKTSLIVDTMKIGNDVYKYLYDEVYNITEILKNNEVLNKYTYDNRSELLSDVDYELNRKYVYTYDNEGNILSKKEYNLETNELINTDTFTYGNPEWEDQLTKFNGDTITYDAIGNPTTVGNKHFGWRNGRQLTSYVDDDNNITYSYNQNGIRTVKEFAEKGYINYYLEGNKIVFEERCPFINGEKTRDVLYYMYDDSGSILGFKYNEELYYYQKNYQNDIIGIYDSNYKLVVRYKYDAWGKVISVNDTTPNHIGTINPYRYRSYYYDEETKLYYLNSRYYNPEWCRFINADNYIRVSILGNNLYLYSENNPINNMDNSGAIFKKITKLFSDTCNKAVKSVTNAFDSLKKNVSRASKFIGKKIEKGFNYLKDHFVLRGGSGTGFAIDQDTAGTGFGAIDTTSKVLEYKQNKINEYLEINTEIDLGLITVGTIEINNSEGPVNYIGLGPVMFSETGTSISLTAKSSVFLFFGAYIEIGFEIEL